MVAFSIIFLFAVEAHTLAQQKGNDAMARGTWTSLSFYTTNVTGFGFLKHIGKVFKAEHFGSLDMNWGGNH